MSLYSIAAEYNEPLAAAHARNDDDRYDLVVCGAAGQPTLDLSYQLRDCSGGMVERSFFLYRTLIFYFEVVFSTVSFSGLVSC